MDTISNIQFDDWEAEQMQDPEFRAEVEALESVCQMTRDEVMEQWETLRQRIVDCWEAIVEVLVPAFQQTVDAICAFLVQLRRTQLHADLRRWRIPERFAHWLSDKWPERWLPELRFE